MAASGTKAALLTAARAEFAASGLAGARIDRIAGEAGVNKERIYGHFGSKQKLFDAVMQDCLEELAGLVPMDESDLAGYVARVSRYHRENPELLRLLMWESLEDRPEVASPERVGRYQAKVATFAERFGLPPGGEAGALLYQVIGLAAWPLVLPHLAELLTGRGRDEAQELLRDQARRLADVVTQGCLAPDPA